MLEVNSYELINKCSPFVSFDLIRSVGGRETTATTEKRLHYRDRVYNGNRGYSNSSCTHPKSSNHTTESVKECNDDTEV